MYLPVPHGPASAPLSAWTTPRGVVHTGATFSVGGTSSMHDRLDILEGELGMMRVELNHTHHSHHSRIGVVEHHAPYSARQPVMIENGPPIVHKQMLQQASQSALDTSLATTASSDGEPTVSAKEHANVLNMHRDLIIKMAELQNRHSELLGTHTDLMKAHAEVLTYASELQAKASKDVKGAKNGKKEVASKVAGPELKKHPSLGVVRLDYNYPPAEGDIDSGASFGYDVTYRVVPGMTFEMAQRGKFTDEVERRFAEGIKYLEHRGVSAISGDCGFMMAFQVLARKIATVPVFMSSMVQCPVMAAAFDPKQQILILTANDQSLKPQKDVLLSSCGFKVDDGRFIIKGCQHIQGFDAVAKGQAVPIDIVQPGIVQMTLQVLEDNPKISAILLECTELPPYADALRAATDLPVWDAITAADFYISGYKDNPRFGIDDWQAEWDKEQEEYKFGEHLTKKDNEAIVNKTQAPAANPKAKAEAKAKHVQKVKKLARKQAPVLGVVRLDYNYPPAAGDIDCPGSYDYDVLYRCVPGLTFEMAQAGMMTYTVQQEFVKAIKWLESKGAVGITGDCGFMMAFQPLARDVASVPVFMSSMVQCPMVSVAFDKYDKILILTANSATLKPQKETLLSHCGFDVDDDRFIIQGCQDIPGFDAVAKGQRVDVEVVTPGMTKMVSGIIDKFPDVRSIILECTELPPYADALRQSTGLPVWDAITCADFFISCRKDNPRFGLNQWQNDWDGIVNEYKLGQNLSAEQKSAARYV